MEFNTFTKKLGLDNKFLMGLILAILTAFLFNYNNILERNDSLGNLYIVILLILWTCVNKYLGLAFVLLLVFGGEYLKRRGLIEMFDNPENEKKEAKINVVTKATSEEIAKNTDTTTTEEANDEEEEVVSKSKETINMASEGFDLLSTENNIKRGKQSNSIPVDQLISQASNDEISPYQETEFSEGFSIL